MLFDCRTGFAAIAGLMLMSPPAGAQQIPTAPLTSYADNMLVTSTDVTTCPYALIGTVSVNMRARSYSLKELETDAIATKLREKARKMGAEAVILVTVGQTHMTLTSLRSTPITGRAIRYVKQGCGPTS